MAEDRNILGKLALGHDPNGGATAAQIAAAERYDGTIGQNNTEMRQATNALNMYDNASRSTWETIDQGGKDIAKGIVNTVGGIATAGGLLLDTVAGTNTAEAITGGLNSFNEFADADGDFVRRANQPINQAKNQEIARLNKEKYGDTARGAFADFTDTLMTSSADDVFQTIGEGIGSIAGIVGTGGVAGVVGKGGLKVGAKLAGKKATKEATEKAVANQVVQKTAGSAVGKVEKAVEAATNPSILAKFGGSKELATMALIGGMEGGSQAGEFITTVMDTPYETLMETSKQFRDLINQGYTEQEARQAVAKSGALTVLAEVGLTAAALGKLVSKFESAPVKMFSGKQALGNMAREAVEETSQSVGGAMLTNYNIQDKVDHNKGLYEDVGQQGAMGLIGGIGSAGAIQTPSLAVAGTKTLGKGAYKAGAYGLHKAMGGEEGALAREEKRQAKNPNKISSPTTRAEAVEMQETLKGKTLEEAFDIAGISDPRRFGRKRKEYEAMTANKDSKEDLKKVAKLSMLADMVSFETNMEEISKIFPTLTEEDIATFESTDENGKFSPIEAYLHLTDKLHSNPESFENAKQTFEDAQLALANLIRNKIEPFSEILGNTEFEGLIDMTTPEGRALSYKLSPFREFVNGEADGLRGIFESALENADRIKDLRAKENPEAYVNNEVDLDSIFGNEDVSPTVISEAVTDIDRALTHFDNVDLDSSENTDARATRRRLLATKELLETYLDTNSKVENQIFNNENLLEDGEHNSPSIREHIRAIQEAVKLGNPKYIDESIKDLGKFVKHLRNKAMAINNSALMYRESKTNPDGTVSKSTAHTAKFKALNSKTRQFDHNGKAFVHLGNANSVNMARSILQNANDASHIFNLAQEAFTGKREIDFKPIKANERLVKDKNFKPLDIRTFEDTPSTPKPKSTPKPSTNKAENTTTTATTTETVPTTVDNTPTPTNDISEENTTSEYDNLSPKEETQKAYNDMSKAQRIRHVDNLMKDVEELGVGIDDLMESEQDHDLTLMASTDYITAKKGKVSDTLLDWVVDGFGGYDSSPSAVKRAVDMRDGKVDSTTESTTETSPTETSETVESTEKPAPTTTEEKVETETTKEEEITESETESVIENMEEDVINEDDDFSNYSLSYLEDSNDDGNYTLAESHITDMEESYNSEIETVQQVIEENPSSSPLEVLALIDYGFKPNNSQDHAVRLFMGDMAFAVPDLINKENPRLEREQYTAVLGKFFSDMGLSDVTLTDMFMRKNDKGKAYFDRSHFIKFARRFAGTVQAYKQTGLVERGLQLKDVDINDNSIQSYAIIRAFNNALKGDSRTMVTQRLNTLTSKSRSSMNKDLVGHTLPSNNNINKNTFIEGFDINLRAITPATFALSPLDAMWMAIGSADYQSKAKEALFKDSDVNPIPALRNYYKYFRDVVMSKVREEADKFVKEVMNRQMDKTAGKNPIFKVIREKNMLTNSKSKVPLNYQADFKTINAFAVDGHGYKMDNRILEAFTMAAMDTILERMGMVTNDTNTEEVGRGDNGLSFTDQEADATSNSVVRNVAKRAMSILGLKINRNAPEGVSDGTTFAVAADILDILTNVSIDGKYNEDGTPVSPLVEKTINSTMNVTTSFSKDTPMTLTLVYDNGTTLEVAPKDPSNFKLKLDSKVKINSKDSYLTDVNTGKKFPLNRYKHTVHETFAGYSFSNSDFINSKQFTSIQQVGTNLFTNTVKKLTEPSLTTTPQKVSSKDNVRNTIGLPLTETDINTINALNAIPNTVNTRMVDMYSTADTAHLANWLNDGILSTIEEEYSKGNTYKLNSDKAKYNTILNSIAFLQEVSGRAKDMEAQGKKAVFYNKYNKGRENRNHADGAMNSQTNKIVREGLSSNESTIDISKKGYIRDTYFTALAQGLGIKVNNRSRKQNAESLLELMGNLTTTIETIQANLDEGTSPFNKKVFDTLYAEMEANNVSIDRSMAALHNLVDYARYAQASDAELKNYQTWVYLEVDGVTKGVGDSMAIFTPTPRDISKATDKTGTVFSNNLEDFKKRVTNSTPKTNPDIYATGAENYKQKTQDKFIKGKKAFERDLDRLIKGVTKAINPRYDVGEKTFNAKEFAYGALGNLFDTFDIGATVSEEGVTFTRGFAKRPVMVINYGSGEASVATGIMDLFKELTIERLDLIAKELNTASDTYKASDKANRDRALQIFFNNDASFETNKENLIKLYASMDIIRNTSEVLSKQGKPIKDKVNGGFLLSYKGTDDLVGQKGFKELLTNIVKYPHSYDGSFFNAKDKMGNFPIALRETIGKPLSEAVKEISSISSASLEVTSKINDISSRAIGAIYEARIKRKLREIYNSDEDRIASNGLTPNEYQEIIDGIREEFGLLGNGTIKIDYFSPVSADLAENQNAIEERFSSTRGLTDPTKYRRMLERPTVEPFGVSSAPLLTIGTEGDMVNNFMKIAPKELVNAIVTIHDGYNSSMSPYLTDMLSLTMNLAAIHSWENSDPLGATMDLHTKVLKGLTEEGIQIEDIITEYGTIPNSEFLVEGYQTTYGDLEAYNSRKESPLSKGVISNAMNGADIPVQVTSDGKTTLVPLMELIYIARHTGKEIDIREAALSGNVKPVAYDLDTLGQMIKDGTLEKQAITKYEEGKIDIDNFTDSTVEDSTETDTTSSSKEENSSAKPLDIADVTKQVSNANRGVSKSDTFRKYKLNALNSMLKSPLMEGIEIVEVDSIENQDPSNKEGKKVLGRYSPKEGVVYITPETLKSAEGLDTLYHELTHVVTVDVLADMVTSNYDRFDTNTTKALTSLQTSLTDLLDAIYNVDDSLFPEAFKTFKKMYVNKSTSEMTDNELLRAMAELVAHGTTREDLRDSFNSMKGTEKAKEGLTILKNMMMLVNKFKKALFKVMGISSIEEATTLADSLVFSKELLQSIAEGINLDGTIPPSTPPSGGKSSTKTSNKSKTKAGKTVQETLDLFDNVDLAGKNKATQERDEYRKATLQVQMDTANLLGILSSPQQAVEATALAYALEYSTKTDPVLYSRVAEAYEETIKNLKVEDFYPSSSATAEDIAKAELKYNFIKDIPKNMSSPVAMFASIAYLSPEIGKVLDKITLSDSSVKLKDFNIKNSKEFFGKVMDSAVDSIYDRSLQAFKGKVTADKHLKELISKLKKLTENDTDKIVDKMNGIVNSKINDLNEMALEKFTKLANAAFDKTANLRRSSSSIGSKILGYSTIAPALLYLDDVTTQELMDKSLQAVSNEKVPRFLRELMSDLIGRTNFSGNVYDMIKTVKSKIQALRQEYRKQVPKVIKGYFSKELSTTESKAITDGILKTDLGSLLLNNNTNDVLSYITDRRARHSKIQALESQLGVLQSVHQSHMIAKSKELAKFMVTREPSFNLLRNADQIANLTGEGYHISNATDIAPIVDQLVSLYALGMLDKGTSKTITDLAKSEAKGLSKTLEYAKGIVVADIDSKGGTDFSRDNRLKGYFPIESTSNNTIRTIPEKELKDYTKRGFKVIDTNAIGESTVVIDVREGGTFHQGITQTIRPSVGGADASSGYVSGLSHGKLITDIKKVDDISYNIGLRTKGYENFLPVYHNKGDNFPYAYQYVPTKEVMAYREYDNDFANILANYTGRKVEETLAVRSNIELVNNLNDMYKKADPYSRRKHYVDIMSKTELDKDPVLRDAVKLIPPDMRDFITHNAGGKLYVRRDLLNDVTGYRMALVGDFWTGKSRIHKAIRSNFVTAVENVFGKRAYSILMKTQYGIQSVVADARDIIVVRSIVVPVINLASTIMQAVLRGVSPLTASKGLVQKTREISRYVEVRGRIAKLEAERIASYDDKTKVKDITARIKFLEDSLSRLSIYPLIEAGEFTSIADAEIDKGADTITKGGLLNYVENKIDKLPKGLSTVAKYSVISRDTVLYDALKKLTDYGDFVGKAIVYDHYIKRGMDKKKAISLIREEFVNYDKLQGRTRHTIENLGLAWFWNWKIRATKTFFSIVKHNPLSALLMSFSPLNGVGTPLDESLVNRIFGDKSLVGSLGISQGLNAWKNVPIGYAFK